MLRKYSLALLAVTLCATSSQTCAFLGKKKTTLEKVEEYAKENPKKTAAYIGAAALTGYCCWYGGNNGFKPLCHHLFEILVTKVLTSAGVGFVRPYDTLLRMVINDKNISSEGTTLNRFIAVPAAALGATAHMIGTFILLKKGIAWHNR